MFDQKEIAAYRKISAPVDLRDKVLSSCTDVAPRKKTSLTNRRWLSSVAACLILVTVLTVFAAGEYGAFSVSLSGSELMKEESVVYAPNNGVQSISVQRDLRTTEIPLLLEGHVELSVSDGVMSIKEPDTDAILYTGTEYSMDGKTLVLWTVCADDTAHAFEMTVRGAFKTEKIILSYDESQNAWTLMRNAEK